MQQPLFTALVSPPDRVPAGVVVKCPGCRALCYWRQWRDTCHVCPACGYHDRLGVRAWIGLLADEGSFAEHDADMVSADLLATPGGSYPGKLRQAQLATGLSEALVCGAATLDRQPFELAVACFDFLGGSMGSVYGEKLCCAVERSIARAVPLVTLNASGGARMQEGIHSLMQMAKVAAALMLHHRARLLHISVFVNPCYGGVSASYASLADVILAEPGARIGFAGPRVINQTLGAELPAEFQTAEYLLQHGMIDAILPRAELRATLAQLLGLHAHEALR